MGVTRPTLSPPGLTPERRAVPRSPSVNPSLTRLANVGFHVYPDDWRSRAQPSPATPVSMTDVSAPREASHSAIRLSTIEVERMATNKTGTIHIFGSFGLAHDHRSGSSCPARDDFC